MIIANVKHGGGYFSVTTTSISTKRVIKSVKQIMSRIYNNTDIHIAKI